MMKEKKKVDFPFFDFKNEETLPAIMEVISQYEGILPEKIDQYFHQVHSKKKAQLFVEAKRYLQKFWLEHPHLALSDFCGLINLALDDIKLNMFKKGDQFVDFLKKRGKK